MGRSFELQRDGFVMVEQSCLTGGCSNVCSLCLFSAVLAHPLFALNLGRIWINQKQLSDHLQWSKLQHFKKEIDWWKWFNTDSGLFIPMSKSLYIPINKITVIKEDYSLWVSTSGISSEWFEVKCLFLQKIMTSSTGNSLQPALKLRGLMHKWEGLKQTIFSRLFSFILIL